jgi:hypothetical protein
MSPGVIGGWSVVPLALAVRQHTQMLTFLSGQARTVRAKGAGMPILPPGSAKAARSERAMSSGTAPVATRREWRLHRAHDMTIGQVLGRVVVLTCADWMAVYVLTYVVVEILRDLPSPGDPVWGEVSPSGWVQILAVSISVAAVLGVLCIALVRASLAAVAAVCVVVVRGRQVARLAVVEGLTRAARQPMLPNEALGPVGVASIGAMALFACVAVSVSFMRETPWVLWPLVVVACAINWVFVFVWVFRDLLSMEELAHAIASLCPRLRAPHLGIPAEPACVVCAGERSDRARVRRLFGRMGSAVRPLQAKMVERSAWMALAANHPGSCAVAGLALVWLGLLQFTAADLATVTLMSSCMLALMVIGAGFYGGAPSFFDAVLARPSWRRLLLMGGAYACAMGLLSNARFVEAVVREGARPVRAAFGGYDPNFSMLFVLLAEACVVYAAFAAVARWLGYSPIWSARECMGGSFIPLAGLGIGAAEGGWYPTILLTFVTWVAARSRAERQDWSERRRAGLHQ